MPAYPDQFDDAFRSPDERAEAQRRRKAEEYRAQLAREATGGGGGGGKPPSGCPFAVLTFFAAVLAITAPAAAVRFDSSALPDMVCALSVLPGESCR